LADFINPFSDWRIEQSVRGTLSELTEDEKSFLRHYIVDGQNTKYAQISDGVAKGLQAKNVVFRASNVSVPGGSFPFNLQPVARRILTKRRQLLD